MKHKRWISPSLLTLSAVLLLLGATGVFQPEEGPSSSGLEAAENPLVVQGRHLYTEEKCALCHRLKGKGGTLGPALDDAGFHRTGEWLSDHFQSPTKAAKGTALAAVTLTDAQLAALAAYMNSLGGRTYATDTPGLFRQNCASCHRMNDIQVNPAGVDLSIEGQFRDVDFLGKYIQNPTDLNPNSSMPGFKNRLTAAQVQDLAVFVFRGGK